MFSRWDYKQLVGQGLAVWQPDPSHAGGISETRRIAAMAETYDIAIAPHSAIGPLSLAASFQIDFAIPNALIQEQGIGYTQAGLDNEGADILDYVMDRSTFAYADGYLARPTRPGLGIDIDEDALVRNASRGDGWMPRWALHPDGSPAEM
jgi:galactonate dehydratase